MSVAERPSQIRLHAISRTISRFALKSPGESPPPREQGASAAVANSRSGAELSSHRYCRPEAVGRPDVYPCLVNFVVASRCEIQSREWLSGAEGVRDCVHRRRFPGAGIQQITGRLMGSPRLRPGPPPGSRQRGAHPASRVCPSSIPGEQGLVRFLDSARPSPSNDHGLLMVPPFAIVRADVSWQLAGMSRRSSSSPAVSKQSPKPMHDTIQRSGIVSSRHECGRHGAVGVGSPTARGRAPQVIGP